MCDTKLEPKSNLIQIICLVVSFIELETDWMTNDIQTVFENSRLAYVDELIF